MNEGPQPVQRCIACFLSECGSPARQAASKANRRSTFSVPRLEQVIPGRTEGRDAPLSAATVNPSQVCLLMKSVRLTLSLAIGLTACTNAPRVVDLPTGGIYHDQELGGDWPVVVLGSPFPGMQPEAVARAVAADMPTGVGPHVHFTLAPAAYGRRVVWVFGAGVAGGDGSAVCQSGGGTVTAAADHIRVYVAACRGPSALSAVQGDINGVNGISEPRFRQLVRDVTVELFAPHPDQRDSGGFLGLRGPR